eukprot:CAMPEP_0174827246 /NCGR_PEP_ID=MMETSP1114-20130205/577_1 /TAXON_ID=312471 /ORGANISM="Neobodo designis, Strain CCAP 1951/1" /LENGTH=401 /DNA_ID=CAMNT_0016060859 /DNA_START=567 /DNA_END=1772 /DNA_ORIENTATION=+
MATPSTEGGVADDDTPTSSSGGGFNILVAGLPHDADETALRSMFAPFGDVKRAIIMYKANTAQSRGFGFVLYGTEDEGKRAIAAMDGTTCGGNVLSVRPSKHDGSVEETNTLFVRNIPKAVAAEWLVVTFERALECPVDIVKVAPGSTAAVVTVTLQLDSVAAARRGIEKLHLKPFADLYSTIDGAPPLAPTPAAAPDAHRASVIPGMLVKFAESEQSRAARYDRGRAARSSTSAQPASKRRAPEPKTSMHPVPNRREPPPSPQPPPRPPEAPPGKGLGPVVSPAPHNFQFAGPFAGGSLPFASHVPYAPFAAGGGALPAPPVGAPFMVPPQPVFPAPAGGAPPPMPPPPMFLGAPPGPYPGAGASFSAPSLATVSPPLRGADGQPITPSPPPSADRGQHR